MLDTAELDALAAGFAVLASFHRDGPDDQSLHSFWELLEEWPLARTGATQAGLQLMREARAQAEPAAVVHDDRSRIYGTTTRARVSPYESVHRGEEGLIFDDHTHQVREAYRTLALRAPNLNREPDDHIGLELEFVAQSCLRALDALDQGSGNDAQRYVRLGADFFRHHLSQWAPDMLQRVAEEARTSFMAGLAHLTLGALESYSRATGVPVDL